MKQLNPIRRRLCDYDNRHGSTLLIVVALLGMLAFLGFVFYSFAAQERANAVAFSQEAKILKAPSLEPDALFDFALQQVILGPSDNFVQSVLWGGRHSLLANMYGRDGVAWNGEGISLMQGSAGQPQVDMDQNGVIGPNDNQRLLDIVDSPVANPTWSFGNNGAFWGTSKRFRGIGSPDPTQDLPEPDVSYNSPDINSLFLSYDGIATDPNGNNSSRVIVPSYFRPQYLRNASGTINPWFTQNVAGNQTMRPHKDHVCVVLDASENPVVLSGIKRYVDSTEIDTSVTPNIPMYQSLKLRQPFTSNAFAPESTTGAVTTGKLGIWNNSGQFEYELDVDTDGDGILDAVLMDLGYPPIRRGDGKLVVPLFAISVRDLNGLLNVNATGNLAGNLNSQSLSAQNQLGYRKTGTIAGVPQYSADYLSKSNQGLSTFEINLQRALTAGLNYNAPPNGPNPLISDLVNDNKLINTEAAKQLSFFLKLFDNTVTPPPTNPWISVAELANSEWLMMNIGRASFHLGLAPSASPLANAITDLFPGRFGEIGRTRTFVSSRYLLDIPFAGSSVSWTKVLPPWNASNHPTPLPGTTAADDNLNVTEGGLTNSQWVHPLDFRAAGQQFRRFNWGLDKAPGIANQDDDGNGIIDDFSEEGAVGSDDVASTPLYGKAVELYRTNPTSPYLWPAYSGFHTLSPTNYPGYSSVKWADSNVVPLDSANLMRGYPDDFALLDDPNESIVDPTLMSPNYSGYPLLNNTNANDSVFGPEEVPFLQGSSSDGRLTDSRSRLAEVMPLNLVASPNASDIRKRLTSVSSDRREYSLGTSAVGGIRGWEQPQFPPVLNTGTGDPFRIELFRLLEQHGNQQINVGASNWQFRMNLNRLLTNNGTQLQFRTLTPYSITTYPSAPINATANSDRQQMARDIYTLLFTLCQGNDANYTSGSLSVSQAREMAQFSVNVVDALDTDDVITAFAYDQNLADGWAVTDGLVYGVERQLLTISESLAIRVKSSLINSKMTIFDDTQTDTTNGRRYVFFEIQNVTPMNVTLASTSATTALAATWRVSLQDTGGNTKSSVHFLFDAKNVANTTLTSDPVTNAAILAPGALFTVGSQDGTDTISIAVYRTSDFRADTDNPLPMSGNTYERIVPTGGPPDSTVPTDTTPESTFPVPTCNLDLVWAKAGYQTNAFVITPTNAPGAFAAALDSTMQSYLLALERQASDGTWIAVDKTKSPPSANVVVVTPPNTTLNDTAANVTTELNKVLSSKRTSPLSRVTETSETLPKHDSFLAANSDITNLPLLWQLHNDRDFGTVAELFQIPLYGPDRLTDGRLGDREFVDRTGLDTSVSSDPLYPASSNPAFIPTIAAARFLKPNNPDQTVGTPSGNRWYRLLDFLEVPNRNHQHAAVATQSAIVTPPSMLSEPYNLPIGFGWPRTHGQLNLNMIRHPQVLAALLDEDQLIAGTSTLLTGMDDNTRNWWVQFLAARDSRSTAAFSADTVTMRYVPGTGNARPFRSFDALGSLNGAVSATDSPLEHTILRSLPMDNAVSPNPNERRRLFEVGLATEHFGTPNLESTGTPLHPSARYRLLSKLANNTTVRSNSFAVYVTVQYYEAAYVPSGVANAFAVRIGGRLDDTPTHRGLFVVDRTGATEQMKTLALNTINPVSQLSYSFRSNSDRTRNSTQLTEDKTQLNGIRWKDLVLYRQTLN